MKHRHPFRDAGLLAVVGAVPLLICLFVLPGDRSKALDVYLLFWAPSSCSRWRG